MTLVKRSRLGACMALVLSTAGLVAPAAGQGGPPPESFFRDPELADAVLSPSGRHVAVITTPSGGRRSLAVVALDGSAKAETVAGYVDADVDHVYWVNDDDLVVEVSASDLGSGFRQIGAGLFAARRDGSASRQLVRVRYQDAVSSRVQIGREPLDANHTLLSVPHGGGTEVVVGEWRFDSRNEFLELLPKRVDVRTGRVIRIEGLPEVHAKDWLFDPEGRPRMAIHGERGRREWLLAEGAGKGWRPLAEFDALRPPFTPVFGDTDGSVYVAVARGRGGTRELVPLDLERGKPRADSLIAAPGFDVYGRPVRDPASGRVLGIRLQHDAETTAWLDPAMAALQREVDGKLPGRVNRLSCARCAGTDRVLLVESFSDQDPGRFHVVQDGGRRWRELGVRQKGVEPKAMAQTDFVRIKARDGREIPVWLTALPRAPAPPPAVVLVHGGPWVRGGQWRWEAMRQFLATRGYLVIEPEFRGSTGYGVEHLEAGFRQWGLAMQDDLADALQWAVRQGRADGSRACIAGGSYGGYAALMGLVRHPTLYGCAAAWAAVTDPRLLFEWSPYSVFGEEVRGHGFPKLIGDPTADAEALTAAAPLAQAARIRGPVLLAYGNEDRRVPIVHGTALRDAMKAAGNEPDWVVYGGEGHGWSKPENRVDFARRLEAFLARHLAAAKAP